MQWTIVALNFLYAAGGLLLLIVAYKAFDWLTPDTPFQSELRNGNPAIAIVIASIFIAIGLIIAGSLK